MTQQDSTSQPRVVVAGAGFAGLGAAYMLRKRMANAEITVVSPSPHFYFAPSLIWTPFGRRSEPSIFDIQPALAARGISFVRSPVHRVEIAQKRVVVDNGELPYDGLLVATGGQPDTNAIPGLAGEFRTAAWIVGEESAMDLRDALRRLTDAPAPLVVGVAQGASYVSAAYELALLIDTDLRRRGIRERVPMTFLTAEPRLGDLGFGQTAAESVLKELFEERDISFRTDVRFGSVTRHEITLVSDEKVPLGAAVIMPPLTGVSDIWKSAGLTDETGLIPINERFQHTHVPEVYAAGVAAYFARPVPPLHGQRAPHTGYLSLSMGVTSAINMAASLGHGSPAPRTLPKLLDLRVLDGGEDGVVIASRGDRELEHIARRVPGEAAHRLKESFERYLVSRLKAGLVGGFAAGMRVDQVPV